MPAYMYVHPFFGALTVVLILGAAGIKMKWHKTGNLHYLAVKRFLSEGAGFADFPVYVSRGNLSASIMIANEYF